MFVRSRLGHDDLIHSDIKTGHLINKLEYIYMFIHFFKHFCPDHFSWDRCSTLEAPAWKVMPPWRVSGERVARLQASPCMSSQKHIITLFTLYDYGFPLAPPFPSSSPGESLQRTPLVVFLACQTWNTILSYVVLSTVQCLHYIHLTTKIFASQLIRKHPFGLC